MKIFNSSLRTGIVRLIAASALATIAVTGQASWFTSESAFLAAIQPGYYQENFDGFVHGSPLNGTQTSWAAPGGNGFGWTASCANGLVSNVGSLSTLFGPDLLKITFTGAPVTAFGGIVANTNADGVIIPGTITMTLNDGTVQSITFAGAQSGFLGWAGSQEITSITLGAVSNSEDPPQLSHAYTGRTFNPAPEPMTTVLGILGAAAMIKRRRPPTIRPA